MRSTLLAFALLLLVGSALAGPADMSDNPAQRVASKSVGHELADNDPRVVQAAAWLKQTAAATGDDERQIATTSIRVAHYLYDITKVRAEPLEVLEALAKYGSAGEPLADTSARYVAARRNSPGKTHSEAMAAMAKTAPK